MGPKKISCAIPVLISNTTVTKSSYLTVNEQPKRYYSNILCVHGGDGHLIMYKGLNVIFYQKRGWYLKNSRTLF